jgi:hypothetical protein
MTTTRAGTLNNAFKPGPARIHFACIELQGDVYHVMGIGSIQLQNRSVGISRPCTGQGVAGDTENPILQNDSDQNTRGNGHHRIPEPHQQTEQVAESVASQSAELKLLPAPKIAGLLPARVPVSPPDTYYYLTPERQHKYFKAMKLNVGFRFTLEEIEVTYIDTKPERIELFKRLALPYDLQSEYAANSQRAQDTVKTCKPKLFRRN